MKSATASDVTAVLDELRTPETENHVEETVAATAVPEITPTQEETMGEMSKAAEVVVIPEVASEDEILKAMPSVIKKMLDDAKADAEAALYKAAASERALIAEREARADEAAVLKAAEWSHLNANPAVLGPALRRLAKTDMVLADEVVKALDSANTQLETSVVFTEVGAETAPVSTDDAYSKMGSLAKSAVSNGIAPSFEAALLSVAQTNPELYTQYLNEKKGR